jgi:hypothetical protein
VVRGAGKLDRARRCLVRLRERRQSPPLLGHHPFLHSPVLGEINPCGALETEGAQPVAKALGDRLPTDRGRVRTEVAGSPAKRLRRLLHGRWYSVFLAVLPLPPGAATPLPPPQGGQACVLSTRRVGNPPGTCRFEPLGDCGSCTLPGTSLSEVGREKTPSARRCRCGRRGAPDSRLDRLHGLLASAQGGMGFSRS